MLELQNGIKLETRPFKRIANEVGCSEQEVIDTIRQYLSDGIIKRVGIAAHPKTLGYEAASLVMWQAPKDKIDKIGTELAQMSQITHCYERECPEGWPYNLYTMLHARSDEELQDLINQISDKYELKEYKSFKTLKELKKTTMQYFKEASNETKPQQASL